MKKIVVLSDTHGNLGAIYSIYDILLESDMVFHLGDHFDDMNELSQTLGDKLYRVYGNCDFGRDPKEILVEVEGLKIFATHGDLYGVKRSADRLIERAKNSRCERCILRTHPFRGNPRGRRNNDYQPGQCGKIRHEQEFLLLRRIR